MVLINFIIHFPFTLKNFSLFYIISQFLIFFIKNKKTSLKLVEFYMAGVTRLELATSCVTGRRSNQLSYTPISFYGGHNRTWTYDPLLVRQVLSQLSYATIFKKWCPEAESNHRHGDFQSPALPTELSGHNILYGGRLETRTLKSYDAGFQDRFLTN